MTDRLQANMAAAKMLGREGKTHSSYCEMCDDSFLCDGLTTVCPTCLEPCCDPKVYFDIFTNPSDCLTAVKCLLERGVWVQPSEKGFVPCSHSTQYRFKPRPDGSWYDDPVDAWGEACIEVMKS